MKLFPAIDLYEKKAVRLLHGDYEKMTVYSDDPLSVAHRFAELGAAHIHLVDLEGAKHGTTPNIDIIKQITKNTSLFVEVGGGIRNMETATRYIESGVRRIILGTAAVTDEDFLRQAIKEFGECVAVGVDLMNGYVAVKGWTESGGIRADDFCRKLQTLGIRNIICTDISRDGAMRGANLALYRELSEKFDMDITASGGVSSLEDIRELRKMELYGAIIGKAYYTGALDLRQALEVAK